MWFGGWYDYKPLPRERVLLQSHPLDGNLRLINVVPTSLVDKRSFLLPRPDEGGYGSYYRYVNYRECDEGHGFSHNERSGPPYRGYYSGYQWTRYEHPRSRQPEYKAMRDAFRGKHFYSCHYSRQRCAHKRGSPFLRESSIGGKDSLYSVSGPSLNNRRYPPKQSRVHSSHQSQHRCKERAMQFLKSSRDTSSSISSSSSLNNRRYPPKQSRVHSSHQSQHSCKERAMQFLKSSRDTSSSISSSPSLNNRRYPPKQSRVHSSHQSQHRCKERAMQFLKSSRDTSSSISSSPSLNNRRYPPKQSRVHSSHQSQHRCKERAMQFLKSSRDTSSSISSSKVFKKSSRLTEKEHAEAASKWANEKPKKSEENNLAEIFEMRSKSPLLIDQTEEPKSNTTDGIELYEESQVSRRTKAIVSKMTEIEKTYRQVLETFVMVVEKVVEKDPSLERPIQFAMKQTFHEIAERRVEELKQFIAKYDKST